jgi:hypothetical protein
VKLLVVLALLLAGAAGWWWWQRRLRPLRRALDLIGQPDPASWRRAAAQLEELSDHLPPGKTAEARFGLAYARVRLGRFDAAAAALKELAASGARGRAVLYLDLWLRVRQGRLQDAADLWEEAGDELGDLLHSRQLASVAFIGLARRALVGRDMDEARLNFSRVRKLGVLRSRIPEAEAEYGIAMGVEKLLEGSAQEALDSFRKVAKTAEQDRLDPLLPELGILLCDWRASPTLEAGFDERLGAVIEKVRAANSAEPARDTPDRDPHLLRDLLLWRAVACVAGWRRLPRGAGRLPEEERRRLDERLKEVRDADAAIADPDLLSGLVDYTLGGWQARARAVEALERACDQGVTLPEVVLLLEQRRAARLSAADDVDEYLGLLRAYLTEPRVPLERRRQLRRHLDRFSRFQPFLSQDFHKIDQEYSPSIADLEARGQLLGWRVRTHIVPRLDGAAADQAAEVDRLLGELDRAVQALHDRADSFEQAEQLLVQLASEFLFPEEDELW